MNRRADYIICHSKFHNFHPMVEEIGQRTESLEHPEDYHKILA